LAGTGPLKIRTTEETFILNFRVYTEIAEDGAAAIAGMLNVLSKMVDQLIEEEVLDEPVDKPSIDELFFGNRLEEGREPVVPLSEIPDLESLEDSETE